MSKSGFVSPLLKQIWIAGTVHMVMVGLGLTVGFSTCLIEALRKPESSIKINMETSSWLVSSLALSCFTSYLIAPFIMSSYGRRLSMIALMFPAILGFIVTYFATNVTHLVIGRFLQGLTAGPTGVLGAVTIAEYTSPEYRGVFLNLKTATFFTGCTIVHVIGQFLPWRTTCLVCIIPFVISFAMMFLWPESPYFLVSKRNYESCAESFFWLRGENEKTKRELSDLISTQKEKCWMAEKTLFQQILDISKNFKRKDFLKPLLVCFVSAVLLETNGRHVFPSYAIQIVMQMNEHSTQTTGDNTQTFFYTLCLDLIITFSSFLSSVLVKFMKRRTLLFSTGIISVVTLLVVCMFLYLRSSGIVSKDFNVIGLVSLCAYFIVVNLGCSPIPLALVGEIFPLEHRAVGSCMAGFFVTFILFIMLKVTPAMLLNYDIYGTFAIFSIFVAVSLLALYFLLPETNDKTLEEIENYFNYGAFKVERIVEEDNFMCFIDNDNVVIK